MEKKQIKVRIFNIKGIDPELYRQARSQSVLEGKNIGVWLSEAIALKLKQAKGKG